MDAKTKGYKQPRGTDCTAAMNTQLYLNVSRDCHVDVLSVRGHAVQQRRVVQGAVPGSLKLEKYSEKTDIFICTHMESNSNCLEYR